MPQSLPVNLSQVFPIFSDANMETQKCACGVGYFGWLIRWLFSAFFRGKKPDTRFIPLFKKKSLLNWNLAKVPWIYTGSHSLSSPTPGPWESLPASYHSYLRRKYEPVWPVQLVHASRWKTRLKTLSLKGKITERLLTDTEGICSNQEGRLCFLKISSNELYSGQRDLVETNVFFWPGLFRDFG